MFQMAASDLLMDKLLDTPTPRSSLRMSQSDQVRDSSRSRSISSARGIIPQRSPMMRQAQPQFSMSPKDSSMLDERRSSIAVLSDPVDVGPQPISDISGGIMQHRRSSLAQMSPESIIDIMEREQEAVVLKLMNEIYSLKQENKELRQQISGSFSTSATTTSSMSASSHNRGMSLSLAVPRNSITRSDSVSLRQPPSTQIGDNYDYRKLRKKESVAFENYSIASPKNLQSEVSCTPPFSPDDRGYTNGAVSPKDSSFPNLTMQH